VYRLTTRVNVSFLAAMLLEAAYWRGGDRPSVDDMLAERSNARYVDGWGRAGDVALAALDRDDTPIGAAWYRHFPADDAGYGFVSAEIPELSIGVDCDHRDRGVGSLLLGSLLQRARARDERAMSLSVDRENPARELYRRFGFEERAARPNTTSATMVIELTSGPR
jgi:ribosomal protein S18 acetylase RimI-like enzyme